MKPLVLYHANCADGFGAAFAAWKKLGDDAEYVPVQYGDDSWHHPFDLREQVIDRDIYILDFSFIRPVMGQIFQDARRVVWLDHHATAFKEHGFTTNAPGEPAVTPLSKHTIVLDNNKSGAMLAWEYFHPGTEVPMLIRHIDDRDRWQWKMEGTREFSEYLNSMPYTFANWHSVDVGIRSGGLEEVKAQGAAILRATQQRIDKAVNGELKKVSLAVPEGLTYNTTGLALNAVNDISEIGNAVAKKSGTFSLSFFIKGDEVICSLRSISPYDVSVIAKHYGGGGHAQAAGFKMPIERFFREVWNRPAADADGPA
jgi:uncharacterized protein